MSTPTMHPSPVPTTPATPRTGGDAPGHSVLLLATITLAIASPGWAQGYVFSVDSPGFSYLGAGRTVLWDGALTPTDDGFTDIPIGFTFDFQGVTYSTVRVSANGYLTFGGELGGVYNNTDLPDASQPNGILCPWWDDLRIADYGGTTDEVSYDVTGIIGFRALTVQWASVSRIGESAGNYSFLTFQVRLRENDSRIDFNYGAYGTVGAPTDSSATIGVEHPGGASATVPVLGSPSLGIADWPGANTRISFRPPAAGEFAGTLLAGTYASLSASRTTLFLGSLGPYDDQATDIPIGFPFEFYGVPQTTLRVSTNGYATFPSEIGTEYWNLAIPDVTVPNDLLAPWWDDLEVASLGGTVDEISYEFFGFVPGMRETIVEWRSVSRHSDTAGNYHFLNFQIHLFEDGNRIQFHYGSSGTFGAPPTEFSASCGLEDGTGTVGFAPLGADSAKTFAQFPASGTIINYEPAGYLVCGDCNGDAIVSITDALRAAQHGVGILTLIGTDFLQCNVSGILGGGGVVDVLDSLDIARNAAGITGSLSCAP